MKNFEMEKIMGALWGGAIGDALGAPVEFRSHDEITVDDYIEFGDGTGSITDDTQMTVFTLEAMLQYMGEVRHVPNYAIPIEDYFRLSYQRWYHTQFNQYKKDALNHTCPNNFQNSVI